MDVDRAPSETSRWWWIALIWAAIGLFDATQNVFVMRAEGMHHAWVRLFVTLLISWLPWAVATPLVLHLGRRYPPLHLQPFTTWLIHLSACTFIGLAFSAWTASLERLMNPWAHTGTPDPFVHAWLYKFYNGLLSFVVLYACILVITYVLDSKARLARKEAETARLNEQLSKAQLNALRRQIEPHFLFNTLNSISGFIREKRNDDAINMIAGLSDFLRHVIKDSDRQQVPLREEVAFLELYLDIQKVRFAERLQVTLDVPEEYLAIPVPSLVLQPIVENAIKHGISKRAQGGALHVKACRCNGMLTLTVYNDGPALPAEFEKTALGVGISNIRTRLKTLYGDAFELTMCNQDHCGVEVSVSVPFSKE